MKNKKIGIIVILLLAIGFAAVTTTLFINGETKIATDKDDFKVYFSGAELDGVDVSNLVITSDKKHIEYTSKELKQAGVDKSVLEYEVTNGSKQYDADVTISCKFVTPTNLLSLKQDKNEFSIEAGKYVTGKVEVELLTPVNDPVDVKLACDLDVIAKSRLSLGGAVVGREYQILGTLVDQDDQAIANEYIAMFSDEKHIARTDENGFFTIDGLERGMHEFYYMGDIDPKDLNKDQIVNQKIAETTISTNNKEVKVLSNNYKIKDVIIKNLIEEPNNRYDITFNADGGLVSPTSKNVVENSIYGELPIPEKEGYIFDGWYLGEKKITKNSYVFEKEEHELEAKWHPIRFYITFNANGATSGSMDKMTCTYDEDCILPASNYEKKAYIFAKWGEGSETGTLRAVGTNIKNITSEDKKTIEMYATWASSIFSFRYVSANPKHGTVTGPDKGEYYSNEIITVKAIPADGYVFVGWTDQDNNMVSTEPTYSFTLPRDTVLTASFSFEMTKITSINVLNVYPNDSYANYFKNWMNSYGQGKIHVTPVHIDNFNNNPSGYLGTSNNWKYDVIVFGFCDANNGRDLNAASLATMRTYLDEGHSVIFGHDTIYHTNFTQLASYANITMASREMITLSTVKIVKDGVFTTYPHKIGGIGTQLTIPASHVTNQVANGDIWLKFVGDSYDDNRNSYLTTWKNTAMIQTGHSGGSATVDEQKILANIVFYMYSYDLMNR